MPTVARLLIVEDEPIVGWQLSEAIEDLGYEVCAIAADADEAVRLAAEHEPDLVLMDVRLRRGTDGVAAAAAICARRPVPIVFCTAFAQDPATRRQLDALAPAAILSKPVHSGTLRPVLRGCLAPGAAETAAQRRSRAAAHASRMAPASSPCTR